VKVTILLLSVDEAPLLADSLPAALAAVRAAAGVAGGRHRVVVVDNACTDGTAALIDRYAGEGAEALALGERLSYAAAINAALAQTGGDAVLLLNADCFLQAGFLAAALPRLVEDGVGSVAPKLVRAAAAGQSLGQIDAAGMFVDRRRKNGLVGHGRPQSAYVAGGEAFGADGAAALYRRETLEQCALRGGEVLDEDMEMWASDADLAWRARLLGWRCVYEPRAVALHIRTYSPSTRATVSERARRTQFRNRYLMMVKNETGAGLRRDAARIAGYEVLALGHALLRERHLLGGYREALRLLPRARARRRLVQARRRIELPPFGLQADE
jgi:GT2 family glycosyltransferase